MSGTAAIGSGIGVAGHGESVIAAPARTAAALPMASDSDSGIHRPSTSSSADRDHDDRQSRPPSRAGGCATRFGVAERHVDQVPQRRDEDDAARNQEQRQDDPGAGAAAARNNWYSLMKIENGATPISASRLTSKRHAPQPVDAQRTGDRVHLVAAEALPETPDREERQRLADRMVQRVKQRRKGAERARARIRAR